MGNNPHIRFSNTTQAGYTLLDISRQHAIAHMYAVDRMRRQATPHRLTRIVHEAGAERLLVD